MIMGGAVNLVTKALVVLVQVGLTTLNSVIVQTSNEITSAIKNNIPDDEVPKAKKEKLKINPNV